MRENLASGYANNQGADQPAHLRSLISAFVIRFLESMISILTTSEIFISLDTRFSENMKVSKGAKIRNRHNPVPHLTQDTNGKVTNSQLDTTNESQEDSPFPAGDHKAHINRRTQRHCKHKTIHKKSTALEQSVKYFTGGLKPVSRPQPHP